MTQITSELQLQNRAIRAKADVREGRVFDSKEAQIILDLMERRTKNTSVTAG
jgi:hypothetical protein